MAYCFQCEKRGAFITATRTRINPETHEAEPLCDVCYGGMVGMPSPKAKSPVATTPPKPIAPSVPKETPEALRSKELNKLRGPRPLPIDWPKVQRERDAGVTPKELASKYDCSPALIMSKTKPRLRRTVNPLPKDEKAAPESPSRIERGNGTVASGPYQEAIGLLRKERDRIDRAIAALLPFVERA